ncbi:MAG: hypothetical protein WCG76_01220 [Verrucomicrobiota bacterium]
MTTTKHYKCQNFGVCPLADKEELIHFDDDDRFQCHSKEHTECPSKRLKCREELVEVANSGGGFLGKIPKPALIAVPAVALVLIVAFFLSSGTTPVKKEKAIASELKKIWPWLSP